MTTRAIVLWSICMGTLLGACGASTAPVPPSSVAPASNVERETHARPEPVETPRVVAASLERSGPDEPPFVEPVTLPLDGPGETGVLDAAAVARAVRRRMRPFRRCHEANDAIEERARCVCRVACTMRFPAHPGGGTTHVRYPFVDVDGLEMVIEADGRLSRCGYSERGRVDVQTECRTND